MAVGQYRSGSNASAGIRKAPPGGRMTGVQIPWPELADEIARIPINGAIERAATKEQKRGERRSHLQRRRSPSCKVTCSQRLGLVSV
jgi:hypothetical protein